MISVMYMNDKNLVELCRAEVSLKSFIKAGYNALAPGYPISRKPLSHTLYYILSGEIEFTVDHEIFTTGENGIIHLSDSENAVIKNVSKTKKAALYYIMFELGEGITLSSLGVPRVTKDSHGEYLLKVKSIYKTYLAEDIAYKMRLFGEFSLLLCDLISGGFSVNDTFSVNLKVSKAVQYIRMNYYKRISLETLSNISGYSVSHFRKLFVEAYGVPPQEYMINYRLRKAKEFLVEDSGKTVEEIAGLVGMCSASYFCRKFRESTGISPHKYKNMDRNSKL